MTDIRTAQPEPPPGPVQPCLRRLQAADLPQLTEIYRDAVTSQAGALYSPEQIGAWSAHAGSEAFLEPLRRGYGLVSSAGPGSPRIEAFALLDPEDRLALLYCRGRSSRRGHASALLDALETRARIRGCRRLRTEASQLSRPLLERRGWTVEAEETALYGRIAFRRWRMIRDLL